MHLLQHVQINNYFYEKLHNVFKQHGIDEVYCLSINDSYVMNVEQINQKLENVKVIFDGNGDFTDQVDMIVEKTNDGFGMRSWRYVSTIINDGSRSYCLKNLVRLITMMVFYIAYLQLENVLKYLQSMDVDSNSI